MDQLTQKYRAGELEEVKANPAPYARTLKIMGAGGSTRWISITQAEFLAIKKILTGRR
jgi:hypothetical protein